MRIIRKSGSRHVCGGLVAMTTAVMATPRPSPWPSAARRRLSAGVSVAVPRLRVAVRRRCAPRAFSRSVRAAPQPAAPVSRCAPPAPPRGPRSAAHVQPALTDSARQSAIKTRSKVINVTVT